MNIYIYIYIYILNIYPIHFTLSSPWASQLSWLDLWLAMEVTIIFSSKFLFKQWRLPEKAIRDGLLFLRQEKEWTSELQPFTLWGPSQVFF